MEAASARVVEGCLHPVEACVEEASVEEAEEASVEEEATPADGVYRAYQPPVII